MILAERRGFAFVHLPKNAGTSIERALAGKSDWSAPEKHLTVREIIARLDPERWKSLFTFCVVRNPWDRLVSQYEFSGAHWCRHHFGRELEFNEYVRRVVGAGLFFSKHDYRCKVGERVGDADWSQISRLEDDEGEVAVDFVARYENLEEDFEHICRRIGLTATQLGRENESRPPGSDFRGYYDAESVDIVGKRYAADIELFGYRFDVRGGQGPG